MAVHADRKPKQLDIKMQLRAYSDGKECLFAFERVLPPSADVAELEIDWHYENWGTGRVGCANSSGRRSSVDLPGDRGCHPRRMVARRN